MATIKYLVRFRYNGKVRPAIIEMGGEKFELPVSYSKAEGFHVSPTNVSLVYDGNGALAITGRERAIQRTKSGIEKIIGERLPILPQRQNG